MTWVPEPAVKTPRKAAGFTLVELMIVIAIVGILAAVAIPSFSRTVKKARTAEAPLHIERLWSGAVAYYEADHANSATIVVAKQFPGLTVGTAVEPLCCPPPCPGNHPVYAAPSSPASPWQALGFNIADPHYYSPRYYQNTGPNDVRISVLGNLDCDLTPSTFLFYGNVVSGTPQRAGSIHVVNEIE